MAAGKVTHVVFQWLASHPVICYLALVLTASIAIAPLSSHQFNQQWLKTATVAGDIARKDLTEALNPLDNDALTAIISDLGQSIPQSRINLVSSGGSILASYPQSAEDTSDSVATMARKGNDSTYGRHTVVLNENGDTLQIFAHSGHFWQIATTHSITILLILLLTSVCAVVHYWHYRFKQSLSVAELLQKLQQSDPEYAMRLRQTAYGDLSAASSLDDVASYVNQLQKTIQFQRHKQRQFEIELKSHRYDLGSLVEGRTAELTELNKLFVQQQFDAKSSALEAKLAHWEAEKANQDKTRFLAAASHDLRQPMHAMNLFVEALEPELQTSKARQIHSDLLRSLDTMKELFNSLLDISKLEAGVMQPEREDFRIQHLFDRLEIVFRQQAIENDLDLRIVASRYTVHSDPHMLLQVLVNLVSNAIKYTSKGYVFVACRRKQQQLRLLVWDTGPGIPKHEQSSVFKEFVQLSNPERDRSKGLGLGLSIFKRTCQLLGHPVRFSSVPSVGTRFEIIVPMSEIPRGTSRALPLPDPIESVINTELKMQRVLVIDDDPAILLGMEALLESWNLQPELAISVDDAISLCLRARAKPELIISDLRLSDGITGVQAIQAVNDYFRSDIPAILITGDTSPERLKLATEAPYPLLHKPIKPAQLRTVCTAALNQQQANKSV